MNPTDIGFLCQSGGADWRSGRNVPSKDTSLDGYLIISSHKNVVLACDFGRSEPRVTRTVASEFHLAPFFSLVSDKKTIPGTISTFAKEIDMRRDIGYLFSLFRQHGGNTRLSQCVFGPLAAPDARKLFMWCVRFRARAVARFRSCVAKSNIFHKCVKCESSNLCSLLEWDVARSVPCQSSMCQTSASRALTVFRWVAPVFDVDLHLTCGLVTQQSHAHDHSH